LENVRCVKNVTMGCIISLFSAVNKTPPPYSYIFFQRNFSRLGEKLWNIHSIMQLLRQRYSCMWRWRSSKIKTERTSTVEWLYTCLVSWIFVFRINSARSNGCHGGPEIASRALRRPRLEIRDAIPELELDY